jgi:putative transcriptional regulator
MDKGQEHFEASLLQSVRNMKARTAARVTRIEPTMVSIARTKIGMSQSEFAGLLGVSIRTYQQSEQGRRSPTGAA